MAFYLSSLKYNNITIVALYSFVIIYTIGVIVGTPFLIYGVWLTTPLNWCHIHTHSTLYSSISIGAWIILDVIISIILCYLFIRPIKEVLKATQQNVKFIALYVKYALLTYISIFFNLSSLLVYLFKHLTIFIEVTAAINCICIILMHTRYDPVFDCFCGCIIRCFVRQKDKKIKQRQKDKADSHEDVQLSLKGNANEDDSASDYH